MIVVRSRHLFGKGIPILINRKFSQNFNLSFKDPRVQKFIKNFSQIQNSEKTSSSNTSTKLSPIVPKFIQAIQEKQEEMTELDKLAKESTGDEELKKWAEKDKEILIKSLEDLESQFFSSLFLPEPIDSSDIVLEILAGAGGQEAMLFVQDLYFMYKKFSFFSNWNFEEISADANEIGGYRYISAVITGKNVFNHLKYEKGVHRVQRVPKTEKAGRVHTSTVAVVILPQPNEIQVVLKDSDLKIETKRASGPGGQHVNKTDSAIRITHIPTGIVSECQMERSQIRNKAIAFNMLRAKIYEKQSTAQSKERNSTRKLQIGNTDRSEKIRTYNFMQDRVTDHRIGLTAHNLKEILNGEEQLSNFIEQLKQFDENEKIIQYFKQFE